MFNESGRLYAVEVIQVFVKSLMDKTAQAFCGMAFDACYLENEILLALRDGFFIAVGVVTICPWWETVIVTI